MNRAADSWKIVNLGEVISHRKEFIEIDDTAKYKRCRVQLHAKGIVLRDEVEGITIKTKKQQVCQAGELLVAEIDAKVGGFGIVPLELDGAIVSSHYFLYTLDPDKVRGAFLDYFVRTPFFRGQVKAQGSTNYAAIRPQQVLDYEIPLPPLSEQRQIVAKIERLAGKVEEAKGLRHSAQKSLTAIRSSLLQNYFEPTPRQNGNLKGLESVCETIVDCLHSNPVYSETGIPTVRSPDVGWGNLLLSSAKKTDEMEYIRRTRRAEPKPGDIILVREGGGTGKAGIVEGGQKLSLGQRVMQIRPNRDKIDPRYFLYQWLSPKIQSEQIETRLKGSASPHLNIKDIRRFTLFVPSLSTQRDVVLKIERSLSMLNNVIALQIKTASALDAMLPSILDRAFKGEL